MFKVAGPLWAQATAVGDNVFARLVKTGKKVLRRVLQKEFEPAAGKEIPKPTWSLRAQSVQVSESSNRRLIGGLFPKQIWKTQAAEVRRQAALRLIRDSRKVPVFAFVGLSLGIGAADDQTKTGGNEIDDVLCTGIRGLFQRYGVKEGTIVEAGQQFSLETLQLGQLIGKGCNAAVYEARPVGAFLAQEDACSPLPEDRVVQEESFENQAEIPDTQREEEGSSVDATGNPPVIFHTDDHIIPESEDDDDDFIIINEDEVNAIDPVTENGVKDNLDGWVLYRVSSQPTATATAAAEDASDSDSDIFILAGDGEGLESVPDIEDVELGWSVVNTRTPEVLTSGEVSSESTRSSSRSTMSSAVSSETSLASDSTDTCSSTMEDPEPAPNISGSSEYPLAVKMMFNYSVESQADRILTAMAKETVPAQSSLAESVIEAASLQAGMKRLPPHPNIVAMHGVFVDQTPELPGGTDDYPSALPPRLNREGGFGRNATMFLVMKKYSMTLREYMNAYSVSTHTRCLLFAQLLEGVAHLGNHGIAHRDLKSDNVLVDLSCGADHPYLAISDFGCCLADVNYGLKLPYLVREMDRGGNGALMAPEIKCTEPGKNSVLDYTKADLWAAGALGYEIFGDGNPFYRQFDARSYREEDLPKLPENVPGAVARLIELMLKRNPSERPTPAAAASAIQIFLWAPEKLQPFAKQHPIGYNPLWRCKELCYWLEQLTVETVCQRVFGGGASQLDLLIKTAFLSRVSRQDVFAVVALDK
ncbi:hypothetical protein V1264_007471 [Littorina saxatilis]|uniref:non-specific serine/threonine protein kinase n=1 Tax=Littorina saxatilis TaxID=31220 RepID=A0AAN9AV39_9CAEN